MNQKGNHRGNYNISTRFNENENTIYSHLCDVAEEVIRRKFIALNAYVIGEDRSEITKLSFQFRKLKKRRKLNAK